MRYYLYLLLLFFFVFSAFTIHPIWGVLVLCMVGLLFVKYVKERRNG